MGEIVRGGDMRLQTLMAPVIELLFREGNPVGIKAAMAICGRCKNVLRLPLVRCSDGLYEAMKEEIRKLDDIVKS